MDNQMPKSLLQHFSSVDPRIDRTKRHKLIYILVIAICATICGAETWEDFELFGYAKNDWFKHFLNYQAESLLPTHSAEFLLASLRRSFSTLSLGAGYCISRRR